MTVYLDGTRIDWSSVRVMADGNLASAVYVDGEKVWPYVAPPRPQALYCGDASLLLGGMSSVVMYPTDGPYGGPSLGMSVTFPVFIGAARGALYVADAASAVGGVDTLWRYDGVTQTSVPLPGALGVFAVDSHGVIYMLGDGATLYRIDNSSQVTTVPLVGLSLISSVAVGPDDAVYVIDNGAETSGIYRFDGVNQTHVPRPSAGVIGLAIDANGLMYMTDQRSVYRYDGVTVDVIPFSGLSTINSIAVDSDGVVYAASAGSVYRYDNSGQTPVVNAATSGRYIYSIAVGPSLE